MKIIALIARREIGDIIKTIGFWIGLLVFPAIVAVTVVLLSVMQMASATRYYILVDQTGRFESHIAAEMEGRSQFAAAELPAGLDAAMSPQDIVEGLRPYLNGERRLREDDGNGELFALILLPADIEESIVRPYLDDSADDGFDISDIANISDTSDIADIIDDITGADDPQGIQYWARNLTADTLPAIVRRTVNEEIRRAEYTAFGLNPETVADVQEVYLPLSEMDPAAAEGEEEVGVADRVRQYAPVGFMYLIFISLMTSLQYLLGNTMEEKSSRIIDTLLTAVTPGEMMAGKLLGIGFVCILPAAALLLSAFAFAVLFDGGALLGEVQAILGSELILWFLFYYLGGYVLYSCIYLAVGSLCNNQKEAQGMMMPLMLVQILPVAIMMFVLTDPNNAVARVLSWVPFFTPYLMMVRVTAPPPMIDLIGTSIVLLLSIPLMVWLSGRVFRLGVLRAGQPPRIVELWRMLRGLE